MLVVVLSIVALVVIMLITTLQRRKGQPLTMRDRLIGSLTPAMIGAGVGFAYARETMDPEALEGSSIPGMYAVMGSVIAILAVRVFSLLRVMFSDFFGKSDPSD